MLNINEAMRTRHSVRKYTDMPIEQEIVDALNREISSINNESGLKFTLFTNEPEAFKANKPSYGSFSGCRNYIALVGSHS